MSIAVNCFRSLEIVFLILGEENILSLTATARDGNVHMFISRQMFCLLEYSQKFSQLRGIKNAYSYSNKFSGRS
jgi:hypothetical protein